MQIIKTKIPDVVVFEPRVFADDRGYFFESFKSSVLAEAGIHDNFVQDNESKSSKGVLRGLHYQIGPMAMSKLVRVIQGAVLDVAVDIREGSPTYGQWHAEVLSGENKRQMYVPRGFAHGFLVLEDDTVFSYKCDNVYSKEHEGGIIYNDPTLNIDWGTDVAPLLSEKDLVLPTFGNHLTNFKYND